MALRFRPERITEIRTTLGLSQAAFARRLAVSRQIVSRWELGQYTPSTDMLLRLATVTGAKMESFFADEPAERVS